MDINMEGAPEHLRARANRRVAETGIQLYEGLGEAGKAEEYRALLNQGGI
jgi:hypothetical protein